MRNHRRRRTLIGIALLCGVLASGCVSGKTVLVPEDTPVRTGPNVKGRVDFRLDGEWRLTEKDLVIPEGWYVIPPRFVHPEDFDR